MPAKSLMIQGTASHAGKSILATAFCRLFAQEGFRVAPFKSQNMSLNAMVTKAGEEIAVAQVVQAEAAGVEATAAMNPILLKPIEDRKSQVILMGRPVEKMGVFDYDHYKKQAFETVKQAYQSLASQHDLIVIEGAGSPAEVNLKENDIANMRIAELANAPVILVTDIDRGGAIASLVGTMELLEPAERNRVIGFVINKFRGERKLLDSAIEFIERRLGKPVIGVIPFIRDLRILSEDSVSLEDERGQTLQAKVKVAVVHVPHMANFTDFAPLQLDPEISCRYVSKPDELTDQDMIILPGTRSTIQDMHYLWQSGMAAKILSLKGKSIIFGLCGGYQMLGSELRDPHHVESDHERIEGLDLINAVTVFEKEKRTAQVRGRCLVSAAFFREGEEYSGYEIHMGQTILGDGEVPLFELIGENLRDGVVSEGGKVIGTYLHGIFDNDHLRREFGRGKAPVLRSLGEGGGLAPTFQQLKFQEYDRLASIVRNNLDFGYIKQSCKF